MAVQLFADVVEELLSQGDVFVRDWNDDRTPLRGPVVVLSEGCEIEKAPTVLVAKIEAESDTEASVVGNIRAGRVWHALSLAGMKEPGWVNLRTIQPVEKSCLEDHLGERQYSMTPAGRLVLAGFAYAFLRHAKPPEHKYFRNTAGAVWDVWEVTRRHIAQAEDKLRKKLLSEFAEGWLAFFHPSLGPRRVAPCPPGWQYLPDEALEHLCNTAKDGHDLALHGIEQMAARPGAKK